MNSLYLQNDSVVLLYYEHDQEESFVFKKKIAKLMVDWFFDSFTNIKGVGLYKNKNGKPFLSLSNYQISISNSKNITVCAISTLEIGIDIEFKRNIDQKCFLFINKLYSDYLSVHCLEDWVRLESSLKLKNLKLDSVAKKTITNKKTLKKIIHKELHLNENYYTILSSNKLIKTINYQSITYNKLKKYVTNKSIS
jgi:hypothetical protein